MKCEMVVITFNSKIVFTHARDDDIAHLLCQLIQLKTAQVLDIPTIVTEQYPERLQKTVPELHDDMKNVKRLDVFSKTRFSMITESVEAKIREHDTESAVLFGIEVF